MMQDERSASRAYFRSMLWRLGRWALLFLILGLFIQSRGFRSDVMRILFGGDSGYALPAQQAGARGEEKKPAEESGALGGLGRAFLSATGALLRGAASIFDGRSPEKQSSSELPKEAKQPEATPSPAPSPPANSGTSEASAAPTPDTKKEKSLEEQLREKAAKDRIRNMPTHPDNED